jgi:ribosomal protein S16
MANIKYRSLKIKFLRMGRKKNWFYYIWLFKNKKKFKLIGRFFPHHFKVDGLIVKVCIVNTLVLNAYIKKGAVMEPKIARLFQGIL